MSWRLQVWYIVLSALLLLHYLWAWKLLRIIEHFHKLWWDMSSIKGIIHKSSVHFQLLLIITGIKMLGWMGLLISCHLQIETHQKQSWVPKQRTQDTSINMVIIQNGQINERCKTNILFHKLFKQWGHWFQYKIIEILLCTLLPQADKIWVPKRDTQVQPSVLGLSPWEEFSYHNKSSIVPWFPSVQPPPA